MKALIEATIETLEQVRSLITLCAGDQYDQASVHSMSGVGRHVRHILDHFIAVKGGAESGLIDYNVRQRDSDIESNSQLALQRTDELIDWLSVLGREDVQPGSKIQVVTEISVNQTKTMAMESNLDRELCYLINHTVHHLSYASLVAKQLGFTVDDSIGLAPGTATYLRQTAEQESHQPEQEDHRLAREGHPLLDQAG